jgi:hypothetical protein
MTVANSTFSVAKLSIGKSSMGVINSGNQENIGKMSKTWQK